MLGDIYVICVCFSRSWIILYGLIEIKLEISLRFMFAILNTAVPLGHDRTTICEKIQILMIVVHVVRSCTSQ